MKKHHMPEMKEGSVNVTPLIDIIMCLIIFYMLVARIGVDTGQDKDITIPKSILGAKIEDMGNTLTLNVRPNINSASDEPSIDALVPNPATHEMTMQTLKIVDPQTKKKQLKEVLEYFRFGPDKKRNTADDNPKFKVIIRGDAGNEEKGRPALEYRQLEGVLMTCAEAAVANVNFQTQIVETSAAGEAH